MSDLFNLKRNVVTSIVAFGANIVLVFVGYRLVILQDGIAAIGLWSTLMAWVFLIRLGDVGMANAVVRFAAACDTVNEPFRVRRYVDSGLIMNVTLFMLLSFVGWLVLETNLDQIFPDDPAAREISHGLLPLIFAGFFVQNLSGLMLGALRSIHLGYVSAKLTVAGTLMQLAIVVPLVPKLGLAGLAWGQFMQYTLTLVAGWIFFVNGLSRASGEQGSRMPRYISFSTMREMLGFSVRAQVANLANGLFEPISKIIIGRSAGLEALGLFELAFKLVALPRNAVISGVHASIPAMTRLIATDIQAARALYRRSLSATGLSSVIVLAVVTLSSPLVAIAWLGRYEASLSIFTALLAAGFLANAFGAPAHTLGVASGQLRGNIEAAVLAGGLAMVLTKIGGAIGPTWLMVAGVALALAVGGLWVRLRNERLLFPFP